MGVQVRVVVDPLGAEADQAAGDGSNGEGVYVFLLLPYYPEAASLSHSPNDV